MEDPPRSRPTTAHRVPTVVAASMFVLVALGGCLVPKGSAEVALAVDDSQVFEDFSSFTVTLRAVRTKGDGENPVTLDSQLTDLDLLAKAGGAPFVIAKGSDLRIGPNTRVDVLIQPPLATLKDGSRQDVIVSNNVLLFEFPFNIEKDETTSLLVTITLLKANTTAGVAYVLAGDPDRSGVA